MNKLIALLLIATLTAFSPFVVSAEGDHDHSGHEGNEKKTRNKHRDHKDNNEKAGHQDHGDSDKNTTDGKHEHGESEKNSDGEHHPHDNDSHSSEGKKSKAILEIEDGGSRFKLSSLSIKSIKLKYKKCEKIDDLKIKIPKEALVSFGNEYGVFFHKEDWFELVEVRVESKTIDSRIVSSPHFSKKEMPCEIVVSGVPLLRVAQLEASGEGGEGHAH